MPTYNRCFCILDSVNHVLNQTYNNFELIIIDDGSTDNTEELIKTNYKIEFESGKIIYKKLDKNYGVCYARNQALKLAKNDWIAYCDTDNIMLNSHLESFTKAIKENSEALIFYAKFKHRNFGYKIGKPFDYYSLTQNNFIDIGVFVHNIELYKKYGGFDENLKRLVDWDLILTYTKNHYPIFIDKVLLDYNDDDDIKRISNSEKLNFDYIRNKHKIKIYKKNKKKKILYKEICSNGRRHIYFFGIKIFSYKK